MVLLPASAVLAVSAYVSVRPVVTVVAAAGAGVASTLVVVGTWCEARAAGSGIGAATRAVLRDVRDVVSTVF